MKKLKYLIVIIIVCVLVFVGIEFFRNKEEQTQNDNNISNDVNNNTIETDAETEGETTKNEENPNQNNEITNGQELLEKAEKTLTARGWAGASNNLIGIKDGIIYYYNQGTGEFRKLATGIEDIYYKTEDSEEITAKQGEKTEKFGETQTFLIYE